MAYSITVGRCQRTNIEGTATGHGRDCLGGGECDTLAEGPFRLVLLQPDVGKIPPVARRSQRGIFQCLAGATS